MKLTENCHIVFTFFSQNFDEIGKEIIKYAKTIKAISQNCKVNEKSISRIFGPVFLTSLRGKPNGLCWKYQEGGGYLVGYVEPFTGEFTSEQGMAYIYPDLYTAFLGAFDQEQHIELSSREKGGLFSPASEVILSF